MTPVFFARDLIFYILVMVYILGIMLLIHEIDIWVSLGFLITYAVYVGLVFLQSKHLKAAESRQVPETGERGSQPYEPAESLNDNQTDRRDGFNAQNLKKANQLVNELSVISKSNLKGGNVVVQRWEDNDQ